MLRTYATPLRLEIKPSRVYLMYVAMLVGVACLSIFSLNINAGFKIIVFIIILYASVAILLYNNQSKTIIWKQDNCWHIIGVDQQASILADSIVLPGVTILNFKLSSGAKKSIVIFFDAIDDELFRKLRVRLKVSSAKLLNPTDVK